MTTTKQAFARTIPSPRRKSVFGVKLRAPRKINRGAALVSCLRNNWTFAAADFARVQGARRKRILSGSVTEEQRRTRAKAAPPGGLSRKWPCGGVAARSQPAAGMLSRRALPEGHLRLNKCLAISETGR